MRYTYSIVEHCFDGAVSSDRLVLELREALHGYLTHVDTCGDEIHVEVPGALPGELQEAIVRTLKLHRDDKHYLPLIKAAKYAAIDGKTRALIDEGFVAWGKSFSLSAAAQLTLATLDATREDIDYPVVVNTKDDVASLSIDGPEELHRFVLAGAEAVRVALDTGTNLKNAVRLATTYAEVQAVIDKR